MFKHSRVKQTWPSPEQVRELVPKTSFAPSLGTDVVVFEEQPVDGSSLPNYSDYQLSNLLAAGIPLDDLSSVKIDGAPSDADISAIENSLNIDEQN